MVANTNPWCIDPWLFRYALAGARGFEDRLRCVFCSGFDLALHKETQREAACRRWSGPKEPGNTSLLADGPHQVSLLRRVIELRFKVYIYDGFCDMCNFRSVALQRGHGHPRI